jgi:hypothetical protein
MLVRLWHLSGVRTAQGAGLAPSPPLPAESFLIFGIAIGKEEPQPLNIARQREFAI